MSTARMALQLPAHITLLRDVTDRPRHRSSNLAAKASKCLAGWGRIVIATRAVTHLPAIPGCPVLRPWVELPLSREPIACQPCRDPARGPAYRARQPGPHHRHNRQSRTSGDWLTSHAGVGRCETITITDAGKLAQDAPWIHQSPAPRAEADSQLPPPVYGAAALSCRG